MIKRKFSDIIATRIQQGSWNPVDNFSKNWLKSTLEMYAEKYKDVSRFQKGEYVHVSSLLDLCPRRQFLLCESPLLGVKTVKFSDMVVWKIGRGIESLVRDSLITQWNYKNIYGEWSCTCGQSKRVGIYPGSSVYCSSCSSCLNKYGELYLRDDVHGVVGSPDFLIRYKNKLVIVEIKSINDKGFIKRKEEDIPLADHILQPYLYYRLMKENALSPNPNLIVMYCKKEYQYRSPLLEFHILASENKYGKIADDLLCKAKILKEAFKMDKLPERECESEDCYVAKKCIIKGLCFQYKE